MAQKIRAVLLAVTTVANLAGFFWSMLTTHGPAISGWALSAAEFEMAGQWSRRASTFFGVHQLFSRRYRERLYCNWWTRSRWEDAAAHSRRFACRLAAIITAGMLARDAFAWTRPYSPSPGTRNTTPITKSCA